MYTTCNIIPIDWILSGSFTMIIVLSLQLRLCSLLGRERESETPPSNYERAFCFWLVCKACVDQCYADVWHTTLTNKSALHKRGKRKSITAGLLGTHHCCENVRKPDKFQVKSVLTSNAQVKSSSLHVQDSRRVRPTRAERLYSRCNVVSLHSD